MEGKQKIRHTIVFFFISLLLFVSCSTRTYKKGNREGELTIISFNIRQSGADDGHNSWQYRKEATSSMINIIRPELFGLQEATLEQVTYIAENCPEYKWYGVGREDGKLEGEIMAIFYKREVFNLLDSCTYWLSETPDTPSLGWDAAYKRTATVCYFEHKTSEKKFYYVNTHLDHIGIEAQQNGLKLIINNLSQINPEGHPLILSGDFNMIASTPAILDMENIMLNTRKVAPQTDYHATFNAWNKDLQSAAIGDNLKERSADELIIDYIFYTPRDSAMCIEYRTITESFANIPFISDHYPIFTRLILK